MANIAKRSNGSWRARYRDAHGAEHARHFTRRVDAQRWLDSVTTAVQTGLYVDPNRVVSRSASGRRAGWPARPTSSPRRTSGTPASCANTSCRRGQPYNWPTSRMPTCRPG
jgi:hypothetical protein